MINGYLFDGGGRHFARKLLVCDRKLPLPDFQMLATGSVGCKVAVGVDVLVAGISLVRRGHAEQVGDL